MRPVAGQWRIQDDFRSGRDVVQIACLQACYLSSMGRLRCDEPVIPYIRACCRFAPHCIALRAQGYWPVMLFLCAGTGDCLFNLYCRSLGS